jgi:ribonuclease BN (tRNA processing enzyme)
MTATKLFLAAAISLAVHNPLIAQQPQAAPPASRTQVVMLGTGRPAADADRAGPATAIVVNGTPCLVDFGPGVVRRAAAAVRDRGLSVLQPANIRIAFATHLHVDHTAGFADLIFSAWINGRPVPLEVYGPKGIRAMADHLFEAYRVDFENRLPANRPGRSPDAHHVHTHEITGGEVYKDDHVTVAAIPTKHGVESYGYRFDTSDRSIVISGDTAPTQAIMDACHGCDVLIHEGVALSSLERFSPALQKATATGHTTTPQLAELALKAKPRLLIVYHVGPGDAGESILREMLPRYPGHVVVGRDLDVF